MYWVALHGMGHSYTELDKAVGHVIRLQCYLITYDSSVGKESACNAGDPSLVPGLGRSPEEKKATHSSILA